MKAMNLKQGAVFAALVGLVGFAQAQQLWSFEDGTVQGFSGDSAGDVFQVSTSGVTDGTKSLEWVRAGGGWRQFKTDLTPAQRTDLANAPIKHVIVDVTMNELAIWKQFFMGFNSAAGGWTGAGPMVALPWNLSGTATAVLDYSTLTVPASDDAWAQMYFFFNGPAYDMETPPSIFFDNFRVEQTIPIESFEGNLDGVGVPEGWTKAQVTTDVTNGTKALKITKPAGAGFGWVYINLSTTQRAEFNEANSNKVVMFDYTTVGANWMNGLLALNDSVGGFRQTASGFDYVLNGKASMAVSVKAMAPNVFDPGATYGQIAIGVNGDGGAEQTITIDNLRVEGKLASNIAGKVTLGDFGGTVAGQQVTLEIRNPGTTTIVRTDTLTLDGSGNFSVALGSLTPGTYDMAFKASHWLRKVVPSVAITAAGVSGVAATLINGDCDGDNAITVFDYNQLSAAFDTTSGDAGWDPKADFDGDGAITVFDYNILSQNFDMMGDE